MAYASASDVSSLTPHLLGSASTFDTSSSPTLAEVTAWLSTGCALINAKLASKGYDAVGTTSVVFDFVRDVNATYAAYRAERSRLSARVSKQENTRGDVFKSDFEDMLEMLTGMDLSRMGVGRSLAPPTPYSGGTSKADKEEYEADTDRIAPRFARGMFENSETQKPDTSRANEQVRDD